jgi:hypothetical protein
LLENRLVPTAVAVPTGIVSWWTANNTANDVYGLNNATLTGVTYVAGEVGQAFSFNGSTSRAEVADSSSLAFTASFTIEGWIKVSALPSSGNHAEIMFRGADGSTSPYFFSVESDGDLSFAVMPAIDNGSNLQTPISTGQWTHVAATLDDATGLMSLYVNGVLAAQTTTDVRPFATLPSSGSPGIGIGNANGTSTNDPFNGQIDELSVYNRALTSGEILGIYKAGSSGKVSSPIAVSNPSVVEGPTGTTQSETFTITRTGSTTGSLTVNWTTADDTAKAGTDYVGASGTVTFASGQATATVNVTVNGSNTDGPNKDFELIATPSGGTSVLGVGTIQNANSAVSISDASATEGNTAIRYFDDFVPVQAAVGGGRYFAFAPASEGGNLYYSTRFSNDVLEFDGKTGAYLGVVIPAGANPSGTNPFNGPWALAFGPDGNLYVAGLLSANVLRYNLTTGVIDEFVSNSAGLYRPEGMTFDSAGDLLVSNSDVGANESPSPLANEVLRFQGPNGVSPGAPLPAAGQSGAVFVPSGSGGLSRAKGLAFGPDGNLYVASNASNTVDEFNGTTGASMGTFISASSGTLDGPYVLAFRPDGLYVSNEYSGEVNRYNATTGSFDRNIVPTAPNNYGVGDMVWDANGNLYANFDLPSNMQNPIRRYGAASQEAFTVSLDYASANPITVSYSTADASALAGTHYTSASGTVVFAPGETSKTIIIQTLDDGAADPTRSFTVTLTSAVNATLGRSQGVGTILDDTKFYVVDGGASHSTYQYAISGGALGNNALGSGDTAPRGVATTTAGTTEWVVDANKTVYVYNTGGALLGSWSAGGLSSSATLTGIATDGNNIWLLDSASAKVYVYSGAASRLSGSQSAASSFSLPTKGKGANANPQDIVTDGTSFWIVDGTALKVFKYTLSGSSLGSWAIDPANAHPTGITINPANVSDIWITDNGTLKVYQYVGAASRTSGSQNAGVTFTLAAGDTNPQGIADPPTEGVQRSTLSESGVLNASNTSPQSFGQQSTINLMLTGAGTLRDQVFADPMLSTARMSSTSGADLNLADTENGRSLQAHWSAPDFSAQAARLVDDSEVRSNVLAHATIDVQDDFWSSIAGSTMVQEITDLNDYFG